MTTDNNIAKAGTLILVDEGSYSDYGVTGFFVVLESFAPAYELQQYFSDNPKEKESYSGGSAFLAVLIKNGLLLEVGHSNLYLGDYTLSNCSFKTGEAK